jgi:hypothetical protein
VYTQSPEKYFLLDEEEKNVESDMPSSGLVTVNEIDLRMVWRESIMKMG